MDKIKIAQRNQSEEYKRYQQEYRKRKKWFTLIEFLIVLLTIGMLIAALFWWCKCISNEWDEYKSQYCVWLSDEKCRQQYQDKSFRDTYCYDLTDEECTELKIKVRADSIQGNMYRKFNSNNY